LVGGVGSLAVCIVYLYIRIKVRFILKVRTKRNFRAWI